MALEKWEEPKTVTALRGFLGFTNYYSSYVERYAELAAPLMDKLKVDKLAGKRGSKVAVTFGPKEKEAFIALKEALLKGLELRTVQPDNLFVLRVDASDRAVGATLEQFVDPLPGMPKKEDVVKKQGRASQ